MTSSLAAERQSSGHSRSSTKGAVLFNGIEDPEIAAFHVASANGHHHEPPTFIRKGARVVFHQPSATVTTEYLRSEIRVALASHYSPEAVAKVMQREYLYVQASFFARILRKGKI